VKKRKYLCAYYRYFYILNLLFYILHFKKSVNYFCTKIKHAEKTLSFWKNKHLATEYGAIGIAAFIIEEFTDLEFLEIMEIGEGADFFLCKKSDSNKMSFRQKPAAKLEISGIWNEKLGNTINMRINIKKRQVDKGTLGFPIYIIVVEFGQLKAKFIKK